MCPVNVLPMFPVHTRSQTQTDHSLALKLTRDGAALAPVELINAKLGLGMIINTSARRGMHEHIYLSLIVIALLAFGIDRLILWIQRRSFPYVSHAGN